MKIEHQCPRCNKSLATEDPDALPGYEFTLTKGTQMERRPNQAPRLRCPCGMVVIVLKASV